LAIKKVATATIDSNFALAPAELKSGLQVAALGNEVWGGITDFKSGPPAEADTPIHAAGPPSPATPVNPEATRSEGGGMEVAEVVAAAVAEALDQQPEDAPIVQEVSVVLAAPVDHASREPNPLSVVVQHAE